VKISRSTGVQLHPTSLPSGRLDRDAYAFVDWLQAAGQSWWQTLPLTPPDEHRSPYKSSSAFAAWPGLLADPDAPVSAAEEQAFREREAFWIGDWERFAGDGAVADQVRFAREWAALRAYAAERGVRLIGDIPIYVAPGSADHVTHPELFQDGIVSGAPPDKYTDEGQLWGNPLYDWPALQRRGYRWWTERFRRVFSQVDLARIDHFRGFVAYWAVPAGEATARNGFWKRGPGRAPFDAARRELGDLPFIAEDLGVITRPVERLRDGLGLPGMVVLQFGYDPADPHSPHRLDRHPRRSVAYTGTHDHDTVRGWYESLPGAARDQVDADIAAHDVGEKEPAWSLIRLALASKADLAMVQLQDVLGLGSEGRMNVPGQEGGGAWTWRFEDGQLTAAHAERLRAATEAAGRLG
jgi:4-alpha-glucanotransferase